MSAISYHFGSKEELYRACLAEDGSNVIQLIESILTSPENEADLKVKLRLFLEQFFEYSINNRDLILMISKDVNSKLAMESIHKIFQRIPEKLTTFFQEGIDKGIIRSDLMPEVLGDLVTQPVFVHTLFAESNKTWKIKNPSDASFRSQYIDQVLLVFFQSILVK